MLKELKKEPYVKMGHEVLKNLELTPSSKLIMAWLVGLNELKRNIILKSDFAKLTNYHKTTINLSLKDLQDKNYIAIKSATKAFTLQFEILHIEEYYSKIFWWFLRTKRINNKLKEFFIILQDLTYYDEVRDDKSFIFYSSEQIAEKSGFSIITVKYYLKELIEQNFLSKKITNVVDKITGLTKQKSFYKIEYMNMFKYCDEAFKELDNKIEFDFNL